METKSNYEIVAVKYLLGELSGAEQRRFEERYFADDHIFEEFLSDVIEAISMHLHVFPFSFRL